MKITSAALLGILFAISFSKSSHAQSVEFSNSFGGDAGFPISVPLEFPKFDSTLGVLTGIVFEITSLSGSVEGQADVFPTDVDNNGGSVSVISINDFDVGGITGTFELTGGPFAYDPMEFLALVPASGQGGFSSNDPATLALFIGTLGDTVTGEIVFQNYVATGSDSDTFSVPGAGTVLGGVANIQYDFVAVPEPCCSVLIVLAVTACGTRRHRRLAL